MERKRHALRPVHLVPSVLVGHEGVAPPSWLHEVLNERAVAVRRHCRSSTPALPRRHSLSVAFCFRLLRMVHPPSDGTVAPPSGEPLACRFPEGPPRTLRSRPHQSHLAQNPPLPA